MPSAYVFELAGETPEDAQEMAEQPPAEVDLSLRPIAKLSGTQLEYSTLKPETRGSRKRECIFCLKKYAGRPCDVRAHMDPDNNSVGACKPSEQWAARQQAVAAELKRRHTNAPKPIEIDDDADGRGRPTLFSKITEKDVEEQYAKMTGACNVSACIIGHPQMRRLLTCAALAGKNILTKNTRGDTPEWAKDLGHHVTICYRKKLTEKVIPRVAEELDSGAKNIVEAFARMYMCSGASDGWMDMVDDPILNFLQVTTVGIRLVNAINASGKTKDKQYICDMSIQSMEASGGCEVYILLWMDGACKCAFGLIIQKVKHLTCAIDPAHSVDNFLKNLCSRKKEITVKDQATIQWDISRFADVVGNSWYCIKTFRSNEKALATYKRLARGLAKEHRPEGGLMLKKFAKIRFVSRVTMCNNLQGRIFILKMVLADPEFQRDLAKMAPRIRQRFKKVETIITDQAFLDDLNLFLRIADPCELMVRMCDSKGDMFLG